MSANESYSSKPNQSSIGSNEEEEDEEKINKINENNVENQSLISEADKNDVNNKNNSNKASNNSINNNENNSKKNDVKESRKSNRKLSIFLNSQKEGNKILKEYDEIIKCDEEDKYKENKELIKKIKELEEKLSSSNKIINDLTNNKDSVIQRLTNTNKKLKNSLELISKKMDEKIMNINLFKKMKVSSRNKVASNLSMNSNGYTRSMFSGLNNMGKGSHFSDDAVSKNNINKDMVKEKELNNAVSLIKILKNDNKRLQNQVDEFEKNKELEKEQKDQEQKKIDRELMEHRMCKEKMEQYKDKIRKLSEKNRKLQEKISFIKSRKQNSSLFQLKNSYYYNKSFKSNNNNLMESNNENDSFKTKKTILKRLNYSMSSDKNLTNSHKNEKIINVKKIGIDLSREQKNNSLPKISTNKNSTKYHINYNNSQSNNINTTISSIFNFDEMKQLNKIFKNNESLFSIIVKKIEIMQKSKESMNNKYKLEKKQYIERIYSMQQQIDYLNTKIREYEIKINILQSQLNEKGIEKKQLIKKVKILSAGIESIDYSGNNDNNINIINSKNEETNDKKAKNDQIPTINLKKIKENELRRNSSISNSSVESNSLRDSDDNLDNNAKDQKKSNNNNNNNSSMNEGETILEENVSET